MFSKNVFSQIVEILYKISDHTTFQFAIKLMFIKFNNAIKEDTKVNITITKFTSTNNTNSSE